MTLPAPSTRAAALERLRAEQHEIPGGQGFQVRSMAPEDAWPVVRCIYAVYGDAYPIDMYYVPGELIEANRRREVLTAVARAASGDVVAQAALYLSSAPHRGVFEFGQATVLPAYRSTFAMPCLQEHLLEKVAPGADIDQIFGEAVCHHLITQKLSVLAGFVETGIEIGLMPAATYAEAGAGNDRVSVVLAFKTLRGARRQLFVPAGCEAELSWILPALGLDRELAPAAASAPGGTATRLAPLWFDGAQVARFNLEAAGADVAHALGAAESEAARRGCRVLQLFVNLGDPCCGHAVAVARAHGYFFGGLLPRWFDTDALLLQRLDRLPRLDTIKLASARSRALLDLIQADLARNPACAGLLASASDWRVRTSG